MNKSWKYFLVGAGAVVAGFFAYALLKDRPEDDILAEPAADTTPPQSSAGHHFDPEYIEHRREVTRRRTAERTVPPTAAGDAPASPVTSGADPAREKQEVPVEQTEVQDVSLTVPEENPTSVLNDGASADGQ